LAGSSAPRLRNDFIKQAQSRKEFHLEAVKIIIIKIE
jgi:hypothetical protein